MHGLQTIDLREVTAGQTVATLRIITIAMAMGLATFGLIVYFVIGPTEPDDSNLLTTIGLATGLGMLVLQQLVGSISRRQTIRQLSDDDAMARGQLLMSQQTSTIVAAAMLEGAGFFNVIIYGFLEGQMISIAMAALMAVAILAKFPLGSMSAWVDQQIRFARETRDLRSRG